MKKVFLIMFFINIARLAYANELFKGLNLGFTATTVVQKSLNNHEDKDNLEGSISADLEISKNFGENAIGTVILSGAYGEGIDANLSSWWGINGDAEGDSNVYIKELWYEHKFFDDKMVITLGKIDMTAYFDSNEVAADETTQFLSPGFVHSIAIEFPDDNGPGVRLQIIPMKILRLSFGWGDADADWKELDKKPFLIGEIGLHPKNGNYRLYTWWRKHEKDDEYAYTWKTKEIKNGWGIGLSIDQALTENVTLFTRLGYQDEKLYKFKWAWSIGGQIKGSFWNRETDMFGAAFAMAMLSKDYKEVSESWIKKDESHLEIYYKFQFNEYMSFSPDFQVIWNAQGDDRFNPVTIVGIRWNLEF